MHLSWEAGKLEEKLGGTAELIHRPAAGTCPLSGSAHYALYMLSQISYTCTFSGFKENVIKTSLSHVCLIHLMTNENLETSIWGVPGNEAAAWLRGRTALVSSTSLCVSPLLTSASMLEACKAVDVTLPFGVSNCHWSIPTSVAPVGYCGRFHGPRVSAGEGWLTSSKSCLHQLGIRTLQGLLSASCGSNTQAD